LFELLSRPCCLVAALGIAHSGEPCDIESV
jgi:hypothetical protein